MFVFQASILLKPFSSHCVGRDNSHLHPSSVLPPQHLGSTVTRSSFPCRVRDGHILKFLHCLAMSRKSDPKPDSEPTANPKAKSKSRRDSGKTEVLGEKNDNDNGVFPQTIPRKPRRGRRSEAAAVEDFVRKSLNKTFESIRQQNSEIMEDKENILKEEKDDSESDDEEEEEEEEEEEDEDEDEEPESNGGTTNRKKKMLVEEEDPNWPLDADVGWGIRASEYFDKHPIKNIIGEDGNEIDWEGEIEDNWVQEINCLEWESFAYHPSPLIVLVFERYNRATDNWKTLKELEKAVLVYWQAKDRLPPRSVKIDINIERDLAYALKVKECPQILFLRGNRILYREKEIRTADELVHMIAFFYYNAKKPSWIDAAALSRPF